MSNLKYDLIAFDCDGTLTDSAKQIAIFCNDLNTSGKYSLPMIDTNNAPAIRSILGVTMEIVFTKYGFPKEEISHLVGICRRTFLQNANYRSPPFPGVSPLLKKIKKQQVPLGLITANLIENVTRDLGPSIEHFTEIVDKHQLTEKNWKKEDALDWMKQQYKSKTPIYIGDTLRDKEAAEKAGWPFIWVKYGWELPPKEYSKQANSVKDISQFLEI